MGQERTESVFSTGISPETTGLDGSGEVVGNSPQGGNQRRTQAERTALSDERMFNAAMALISQQGAARTTLREICKEAGYSRGLANYRFGSKDAFLQELLVHFNHAWEDHLDTYIKERRGYAAVVAANHALESFLRDNADYMRGGYTIWYESIGGENAISEKLKTNHDTYRKDVARWLTQAVDAGEIQPIDVEQFANLYCTFVFGTVFMWLADPDAINLTKQFNYFRSQMITSLKPRNSDIHASHV